MHLRKTSKGCSKGLIGKIFYFHQRSRIFIVLFGAGKFGAVQFTPFLLSRVSREEHATSEVLFRREK
jgi:hypothetical protein